ncbi:hypothetical protein [Streptomyces ficellus]|uniref:Uncharacterized protein n=1 Tax=Streptomyces ficellus TaxID=1977088 RepID=A0A6I6F1F5_9ACTN|nr:hypothetical protein [Streptomyces ficellus]QGV77763.1 hypothetical protein EIZ62_05495 [Streptomyces ficellus]
MTSDLLLALAIPVLMGASGLYALADSWWRRRHPALKPVPYLPGRGPVVGHDLVATAETVVAEAYARYGSFYDTPAPVEGHAPLAGRGPGHITGAA